MNAHKEVVLEELKKMENAWDCPDLGDPEEVHIAADDLLCSLLVELGHEDVVEAFHRIKPKWYA